MVTVVETNVGEHWITEVIAQKRSGSIDSIGVGTGEQGSDGELVMSLDEPVRKDQNDPNSDPVRITPSVEVDLTMSELVSAQEDALDQNKNTTLENEIDTDEIGQIDVTFTITGGNEVPSGTDITEFGVFGEDEYLLSREVRSAITMTEGNKKEFEIRMKIN